MDALFTATSATCVTGLSVRSTPSDFSLVGQLVILALIQIGGVGIMTITSFILSQFSDGNAGLRQRSIIAETLGEKNVNLRLLVTRVLILTMVIELLGALLLYPSFLQRYAWPKAAYYAVFHSISAFCNAGFALYDDSLTPFQTDWLVNLTIVGLIIAGGIGYPVLTNVIHCVRRYRLRAWGEFSMHTKIMLIGTAFLVLGGWAVFFLLERENLLRQATPVECILVPLFHSVSCRTAGFNTIPIGQLTEESLLVSVLLMIVGAGACSTGGGVKVTTISLLCLHAWSRFQNRTQVRIFHRTIPGWSVDRAMASTMLFLFVGSAALTALLVVERQTDYSFVGSHVFLDFLFEVSSALGTVGLSAGLTTHLSTAGRLVLVVLMFIGRLGPISVFTALSRERREPATQYAYEEPLVG
jgi:trk system potassium uptake protein TrkH